MPVDPKCLLPHSGNAIFAKGSFVRMCIRSCIIAINLWKAIIGKSLFVLAEKQRRSYRGVEFCGTALMICFARAAYGCAERNRENRKYRRQSIL